MREKTLEFYRRVHPENHPDISEGDAFVCDKVLFFYIFSGLSLYNISLSYEQAGDLHRAMECARESLRVWQTALPPGHEYVVAAENQIKDLQLGIDEEHDSDDDGEEEDAAADEDDT